MEIVKDLGCVFRNKESKQKCHMVICKCGKCGNLLERQLTRAKESKGCRKCFSGRNSGIDGRSKEKLYMRWIAIKMRCLNKSNKDYKHYGGRGIDICEEWLSYPIFRKWAYDNGYKEGTTLTIERIDNNKGYDRDNCTFETRQSQSINRRVQKNSKVGLVGVNKNKRNNKWYSTVTYKNKRVQFGGFITSIEAVKARNRYIVDNDLPNALN